MNPIIFNGQTWPSFRNADALGATQLEGGELKEALSGLLQPFQNNGLEADEEITFPKDAYRKAFPARVFENNDKVMQVIMPCYRNGKPSHLSIGCLTRQDFNRNYLFGGKYLNLCENAWEKAYAISKLVIKCGSKQPMQMAKFIDNKVNGSETKDVVSWTAYLNDVEINENIVENLKNEAKKA